jgi:hypothetical protein
MVNGQPRETRFSLGDLTVSTVQKEKRIKPLASPLFPENSSTAVSEHDLGGKIGKAPIQKHILSEAIPI